MRTGHADSIAEAHQFGEHLRARHHRDAPLPGGRYLGVVGPDRAGYHDRVAFFDMPGVVPGPYFDAQPVQPARDRVLAQVGTADDVAEVVQDLGDAAHTGAAGADKVYAAHPTHALRLGSGGGTHR